jgi:hypothetical protein
MSENIARNMYSSQGKENYPTQLHLVGHFRKLHQDARNHVYQAENAFLCLEIYRLIPVLLQLRRRFNLYL